MQKSGKSMSDFRNPWCTSGSHSRTLLSVIIMIQWLVPYSLSRRRQKGSQSVHWMNTSPSWFACFIFVLHQNELAWRLHSNSWSSCSFPGTSIQKSKSFIFSGIRSSDGRRIRKDSDSWPSPVAAFYCRAVIFPFVYSIYAPETISFRVEHASYWNLPRLTHLAVFKLIPSGSQICLSISHRQKTSVSCILVI